MGSAALMYCRKEQVKKRRLGFLAKEVLDPNWVRMFDPARLTRLRRLTMGANVQV